MRRAYIGTSGWTYDEWRGGLYAGVPRRNWLAHYASNFDAVEVNGTFYHLLPRRTFAHWRRATPPGFRFTVKSNRYLTHVKRLAFHRADLARERNAVSALQEKLSVVLWQLPAALARDDALLERFASHLCAWPGARHAIEFRHPSWFCDQVAAQLTKHRVAAVQSDSADWPMWKAVTADFVYVRLHGHRATYASAYGPRGLAPWARRIRAWLAEGHDVHVYFDNTALGHAVTDALALRRMLEGRRPGARSAPRAPRHSRRKQLA
jgi:uncharacterized protein YecE (DUF72 family)